MNRNTYYENFIKELNNFYPNEPFEVDATESSFTLVYHNNTLCEDGNFFELINNVSSKFLTEEECYNLTASLR